MVIYTPPTATQPQCHPRFRAFRFAHPPPFSELPQCSFVVHEARAIALPPPSFSLKKSMAASENNPNIGLPNGFLLAKGA